MLSLSIILLLVFLGCFCLGVIFAGIGMVTENTKCLGISLILILIAFVIFITIIFINIIFLT